ncbi:hypothetical protein, partial [Streptomyces sp. NPDC127574]|uniref:hypothetical protein n=1 Tax=Streptomyces sp. NPDC127574 TaxID=3345401 RepID=UPI003642E591
MLAAARIPESTKEQGHLTSMQLPRMPMLLDSDDHSNARQLSCQEPDEGYRSGSVRRRELSVPTPISVAGNGVRLLSV